MGTKHFGFQDIQELGRSHVSFIDPVNLGAVIHWALGISTDIPAACKRGRRPHVALFSKLSVPKACLKFCIYNRKHGQIVQGLCIHSHVRSIDQDDKF
jgi:hypothetical protein